MFGSTLIEQKAAALFPFGLFGVERTLLTPGQCQYINLDVSDGCLVSVRCWQVPFNL